MRLPGAAAWPSVDDQLGITPRTSSDSPGCVFASRKRVSAAHMTFTSDMPTYRGTSSALGPELAETRFYGACRLQAARLSLCSRSTDRAVQRDHVTCPRCNYATSSHNRTCRKTQVSSERAGARPGQPPRRRRSGRSIAKARLGRWLAARNRPMMEAAGKESHR